MADRNFYPSEGHYYPRKVEADGSAVFGASSAIASQDFTGGTFAKVGTGDFSLTLVDTFNAIKSVHVQYNVNAATPTDLVPQVYSVSAADKLIKFKLLTGTVPTDPGTGAVAYVTVALKNSGV